MKYLDTDRTAPVSFWCSQHGRHDAVHVVAAVTVVAEQELVVVLAGAAQGARLALHALPGVLLHTQQHVLSELKNKVKTSCWKTLLLVDFLG